MNSLFSLIIEDDHDLATIFDEAMQAAGFDTRIVRSGDVALAQLAVAVPDVVILDLHLPYVSGVDLLRQIRGNPRLAKTRVIVATADPRLAETVRDEADLVLIKPISFTQLRDLALRFAASFEGQE